MSEAAIRLKMSHISKSFGGVEALRGVDFTLRRGEIHALVGENGAGKSTLMKIIAGVHSGFDGDMLLDGKPVHFRSAREALAHGIGMVHQELSVVPQLTVAENVYLGVQPVTGFGAVDWASMARGAREQLKKLGLELDPWITLGELPIGIQQLVELSRVLFSGASIIILDEPTSALSPPEIERLFRSLRKLRDAGNSIIFISHFLEDVLTIADQITIFRNGRKVVTHAVSPEIDKAWIIQRMIGKGHEELESSYLGDVALASPKDAKTVLEAQGLSKAGSFEDVSLTVRSGEILGIYGFMGCGQIELARALFGKMKYDKGSVRVDGVARRLSNTAHAAGAGIAYVPESRRSMLFHHEPIYKNTSIAILDRLSKLWLKPDAERAIAAKHIERLSIKTPGTEALLGNLSGGNQQKVGVAKWLTFLPKVLILSEPTRGMDVGAKEDVVKIVRNLRDQGVGILVISTEPETVLSLADRIMVMRKGIVSQEFANETISKDRLLAAA
ncbi:MAG: sugar ABC transporter ATP-binding protein [Alphaproteobacteria bacterium]|nr:MAG: sugar ABC transporter ATP-binding protein [Alphaproteobacteria bacterium]